MSELHNAKPKRDLGSALGPAGVNLIALSEIAVRELCHEDR